MVTAPGVILDSCERVVREIDIEPLQVYIEARFVELSSTALHKLGLDWSMLEGMKGSSSFGGGVNFHDVGKGVQEYSRTTTDASGTTSYKLTGGTTSDDKGASKYIGGEDGTISHFNGTLNFSEMYLVLSALERENDTRIFSNPRIIVASGRKATVDMTTKYPNVTVAAKRTSNSNSDVRFGEGYRIVNTVTHHNHSARRGELLYHLCLIARENLGYNAVYSDKRSHVLCGGF